MKREERKRELHLRRTREFVTAARRLLNVLPFEEISIRKIAQEAGMHNSTIYLHFPDADRLISVASVDEFSEYSRQLLRISESTEDVMKSFFDIWESFCHCIFEKPALFYNFFYGKYSDSLTEILNEYYSLFPEERLNYSNYIESMYFGNSLTERCLRILEPLSHGYPGSRITEDNLQLVNGIIVYTFRGYLLRMKNEPSLNSRYLTGEFLKVLHYLVDLCPTETL